MLSAKDKNKGTATWYTPIIEETRYLFSGQGMPYEKVSLLVAMVVCVILGFLFSSNMAREARVTVIDLDHSAYTRQLINRIDASPFMQVTAVLHAAKNPTDLFYRDQAIAVVYFPEGLEKRRYTGEQANVGVFYDNTNTAQTADIKQSLNEIIGLDNAAAQGDIGSTRDTLAGGATLAERNLFNPNGSSYNGETLGFLFFFGSMFFVFATIGMIPRLRLSHQLDDILLYGTPWDLFLRLVPYAFFLIVAFILGLGVLHTVGDLTFSGNLGAFLFLQIFYIAVLGTLSLLFGWTAANPGIASSRMILFVPGGFIFGGPTGPLPVFYPWVITLSHIFPLTWEFHFVRDIITRGASLMAISKEIGAFLLYMAAIAILFTVVFFRARKKLLQHMKTAPNDGKENLADES